MLQREGHVLYLRVCLRQLNLMLGLDEGHHDVLETY